MRHLAAALVFGALVAAPVAAEPMKPIDRQRLLTHLEMTESWLVSEVGGLSTAQLTFQMTPESWSIVQVVEHLAIAEPQYWTQAQASMKDPAATERTTVSDADILWYGIDRTERNKTGDARVPKGTFKNPSDALAAFRTLRAVIRDYAKTTQDDPRSRRLQGGNMEVYQWLLMISSHAQRHVLQIREIRAHEKFPKE